MTEEQLAALCLLKDQKAKLEEIQDTIAPATADVAEETQGIFLYKVAVSAENAIILLSYYNFMLTGQIAAIQSDIDEGLE